MGETTLGMSCFSLKKFVLGGASNGLGFLCQNDVLSALGGHRWLIKSVSVRHSEVAFNFPVGRGAPNFDLSNFDNLWQNLPGGDASFWIPACVLRRTKLLREEAP